MKRYLLAFVYTGLVVLANPTLADVDAASALREGDMKKMNFHSVPKAVGTSQFTGFDQKPLSLADYQLSLADYQGKWVLLNFWATWCAPCRKEMPMLSELQTELGGENFEVVTIATGRNPPSAMQKFFNEIRVTNLPLHRDPKSLLAREMGVLGLPITVIINPEGQEVGRLQGDAEWSSDSAKAMLRALIGEE
ncbi:TlpA family protein disulfide reductase [Puniceibacterium sediminis]|uniref:Thiol-disulfide isomerase or thioredoxin n=1 Tax=Puniceibacterium sediminis TaxID=1608407 RepID=A0A238VTN3_9RHOB|nr:TlpA disulfide reductase family protein [Puniceibacterium sediminis]SNR37606.1 Thiol-disulfide isomerase or thioredoxin [Puniceibacterium sediminis]